MNPLRNVVVGACSCLVAGLSLLAPASAWALSCDDIINMLEVNVPSNIVVQTIEGSGTQFSADDVRCLSERGAPEDVLSAARQLTAADTEPAPIGGGGERPDPEESGGSDLEGGSSSFELPEATDEGDDDDSGRNPRKIDEVIRLYRAKKVLTASKAIFDFLEDDTFPERTPQLHYYLAKSLFDLEMYHAAQHYFMQVVRKGPRNQYFKYALPKLVAIAQLTGNDAELLRVVHKIPPDQFPRKARNHLFYLMGRKLYDKEQLSKSGKYFQQISQKSDLFLRAKYYEGVIHHQRGKYKSAVKAFRDVYKSEAGQNFALDQKGLDELEDLKDLSLINIARIYYELQRFDNADNYYAQVARGSVYWPQSLFERAWANFLRQELNLSLGLLLTVKSPYFAEQEYNPEVDILRALTFFNFCEFTTAEATLLDFEAKYKPMKEEIKAFLGEYESEEGMKLAAQAFGTYFSNDHRKSTLSKSLFLRVLRNRDLASFVQHMDLMDDEAAMIDQQKGVWRDSIGSHLKKVIEKDKERYRKKAGQILLQEMAIQYKKLRDWLAQSQIIRFEIVDAQRVDYEYKMQNPNVDTLDSRKVDFATSKEITYWPFNGEFWEDELGYYQYTEKDTCN